MREYLIHHRTLYRYAAPVVESHNLSCLLPGSFPGQEVRQWKLEVHPSPEWSTHWQDAYGNWRDAFSLAHSHDELEVLLKARVTREVVPRERSTLSWEAACLPDGQAWRAAPPRQREFVCESPLLKTLEAPGFDADDCFTPGRPVEDALEAFMGRVFELFDYDPSATHTFTPLAEVYQRKAGVCQDFAHAAIAELRRRGFAAGYVSGFLETVPTPGTEKLRGADATHAWYAVFIPGTGWCHYDPTNNLVPGETHVVTGWGRDYADVAPIKGVVLGGGENDVSVQVDVWQWPDQVPEEQRREFE